MRRVVPASLPAAHHFGSMAAAAAVSRGGEMEDEATSWPPRPDLELVTRAAKRWVGAQVYRRGSTGSPLLRSGKFEPDFGEVASAVESVREAMRTGKAGVERPPRESVSGTYFFNRVDSEAMGMWEGQGQGLETGVDAGDVWDGERAGSSVLSSLTGGGGSVFGGLGDFEFGASEQVKKAKKKKVTAVFKPADEEPANNCSPTDSPLSSPRIMTNPRCSPELFGGGATRAARMAAAGFHSGEGAYKEVAAYLLDHENFAKVPQTALARCTVAGTSSSSGSGTVSLDGSDDMLRRGKIGELQTKMGAFQVFVDNVGDADDWGPGIFPRDSVHKIAILDIRTLNYDRHGGNILVTKGDDGSYDLVPIDHAFTLPESVQAVPWAIWMDWPAAKQPMSKATIDYILHLDADLEVNVLKEELDNHIRPRAFRSLRIATMLLQAGAAAGLSLFDIGKLIYTREGESLEVRSPLERIVDDAITASESRIIRMRDMYDEDEDWTDCDANLSTSNALNSNVLSFQGAFASSPPSSDLPMFRMDGPHPPRSPPPNSTPSSHTEGYILRFVKRRIDDLVRRTADGKESGGASGAINRAFSMHDFGFNLGISAAAAAAADPSRFSNAPAPAPAPPLDLLDASQPRQFLPKASLLPPLQPSLPAFSAAGHASSNAQNVPFTANFLGISNGAGVSFVPAKKSFGADTRLNPRVGETSPVSPHDLGGWVKETEGSSLTR